MQVVQKVAGFSLGQADILRRAMGKKKAKDMEKQYAKFLEGTGKKGISPEVANAVWEKIVMFAGYGFNKSHSAAYGLLSYRTAYLKANHPVEFMAAVLSSELGNAEKLAFFLTECRDMDITIMGPDVNVSGRQFSVDKAVIRFGLAAIKGVGEGAADAIIAARQEGGPFTSLDNFCERCGSKVNRRVMECLSKAGAFDRFGLKRAQTVAMLDDVMSRGQQVAQDRNRGQGLLFDFGMGGGGADMAKPPDVPEWPARELFGYEKELLGFYVTGHPLRDQEELLRAFQTESAGLLADVPNDTPVRVGGMVTVVSPKVSKKDNRPWVIFSLEGVDGVSECFVFADRWAKSPEIAEILLPKEEPPGPDGTAAAKPDKTPAVFVEGTVNTRNEGEPPKIVVERVIRLADAPPQFTAELHVRIPENPETSVRLLQLRELCGRHAGTTPVILCLICQNGDIGFIRPEGLGITNSMAFRAAVKELFGADCLVEKPARVAVEVKRRFDRDRHNGNGRPPA